MFPVVCRDLRSRQEIARFTESHSDDITQVSRDVIMIIITPLDQHFMPKFNLSLILVGSLLMPLVLPLATYSFHIVVL